MAREEARGKRPFKIWDSWRNVKKGLVVSSFEELVGRGKEKLGLLASEPVRLVLESDGTQVEDGEYFRTLPNNTILLLLRQGERWYPSGVDVIRAAITAIPKIVCETIHALELHDEPPSWKIMDNKGRITVVLHWDHQRSTSSTSTTKNTVGPNSDAGSSLVGGGGGGVGAGSAGKFSPSKKSDVRPSLVIQTSLEKLGIHSTVSSTGKKETLINDVYVPGPIRYTSSPQITVINHDDIVSGKVTTGSPSSYGGHHHRLTKQAGSFDNATIHIHTPECANHAHHPRPTSPGNNGNLDSNAECDFHCCALHEEGRKIAVHKSVATSPIQDSSSQQASPQPSALSDGSRRPSKTQHVRFLDIEGAAALRDESSESETENTIMDDEVITTEKFLLLIDQLSVDQKRHLTIKDIGIILERLSSKIVDVERLDRESESDDCYNWTIKATIRGDVLRELGVIYNGNYYVISEHPGYKEESEDQREEVEEEEEEDRL